jgi:hypothetical protein
MDPRYALIPGEISWREIIIKFKSVFHSSTDGVWCNIPYKNGYSDHGFPSVALP